MIYDDETLMRRVDGELSPDVARAVDEAVALDPALASRLAVLSRQRDAMRTAFPIASDPRDQALMRMIAVGEPARLAGSWLERIRVALDAPHAALWGGLAAAAFVGGLSIGWIGRPAPAAFSVASDATITETRLVRVLDNGLASETPSLGLTFRNQDGAWCRTFRDEGAGLAGLACRDSGRWRMEALAPAHGPETELRTAAAETPPAVLAAVDAMIADDALDAEGERRARDTGWTQ